MSCIVGKGRGQVLTRRKNVLNNKRTISAGQVQLHCNNRKKWKCINELAILSSNLVRAMDFMKVVDDYA